MEQQKGAGKSGRSGNTFFIELTSTAAPMMNNSGLTVALTWQLNTELILLVLCCLPF